MFYWLSFIVCASPITPSRYHIHVFYLFLLAIFIGLVSDKHGETKRYYTLHNTLLDIRNFVKREIDLLNSIDDSKNLLDIPCFTEREKSCCGSTFFAQNLYRTFLLTFYNYNKPSRVRLRYTKKLNKNQLVVSEQLWCSAALNWTLIYYVHYLYILAEHFATTTRIHLSKISRRFVGASTRASTRFCATNAFSRNNTTRWPKTCERSLIGSAST